MGTSRTVLEAAAADGWLFLFIDDDTLSYLELATSSDNCVAEFPEPGDISFGA